MPVTEWRKSSYSQSPTSDCVEIAWRKSSYSGAAGGSDCVEVALGPDALVRDSKNTSGPVLRFGMGAWRGLVHLGGFGDRTGRG